MSANDILFRYKGTDAYKLYKLCKNIKGVDLETKSRIGVYCAQRASFAVVCLHNRASLHNIDIGRMIGKAHSLICRYKRTHDENMNQMTPYGKNYSHYYAIFTAIYMGMETEKAIHASKVEKIYARAVLGYI